MNTEAIFAALTSHAQSTGLFATVNGEELTSAPVGLAYAIWASEIYPISSGLAATSVVLRCTGRIYRKLSLGASRSPADDVQEPEILRALDIMMAAYSGDFTLDDMIRSVDLSGSYGTALSATLGHLNLDGTLYRVADIAIPLIINDAWEQTP